MGLTADGYPRGGIEGQAVLPQPRLGFTWDMTGDRRTVVRGGFGITYDRYQSGVGAGSGATNQPFVFNPTLTNGYLQDITPGGGGALAPQAVQGVDPDGKWPAIYSYSLGVQRELWKGIVRRRGLRRLAVAPQPAPREPERCCPTGRRSRPRRRTRPRRAASCRRWSPACPRPIAPPAWASAAPTPTRSTSCGRTRATATSSTTSSTARRRTTRCRRRCSGASRRASLRRLLHAVAGDHDGLRRRHLHEQPRPGGLRLRASPPSIARTTSWPTTSGTCPRAASSSAAAGWRGPCSTTGRSRGSRGSRPATRPSWRLSISGQDAGNRLLGTYTAGNGAGLQPRFRVNGEAQSAPNEINTGGLHRARDRRQRAVLALLPAQPRLPEPRPVVVQELPVRRRAASATCSCGSRRSTS